MSERDLNLAGLKSLVDRLVYTGDDLEFDRRLAEIDLLIYYLRQDCFAPAHRIQREAQQEVDWDSFLSDLTGELESEKDTVSNNSDTH